MSLKQFKNEWFNHPEWWFSATSQIDHYLTDTYQHLCSIPIKEDWTIEEKIAGILVHDQLARHIVRTLHLEPSTIQDHLKKALQLSHQVIQEAKCIQKEQLTQGSLLWKEWCFVMLPFRHDFQIPMIDEILSCIWNALLYISLTDEDRSLLQRYLKATYQRFPMLPIEQSKGDKEQWNRHRSICEYMPQDISPPNFHLIRESSIGQVFKTVEDPILVSLSGGVDSMVCLLAMKAWNKKVVAVHINYDNRPDCTQEQALVEDWCAYLEIPCWTRVIREIHRTDCMKMNLRDIYESYTKKVRFGSYQQVWNTLSKSTPKVILGHHLDDCMENVLTNIMASTKYNDLYGMEYQRVQDNICLVRPLLTIHKHEIVRFAHSFQVPYLCDSTPEWSSRGQLRDSVLPALKQWIGEQKLVSGFKELNDACQEMNQIIQQMVQEWKHKFIPISPHKWQLHLNYTEVPKSKIFYRNFFAQMWSIYPTYRSIQEMISRIHKLEHKWFQIQPNTKMYCNVTKELLLEWIKRGDTKLEWNWIQI
jgi:tRNA(Ile)-lysidine synthetase-like protein